MRTPAGRRHRGRELALRVLFEVEGTERDADEALAYQAEDLGAPGDVRSHARRLVHGCLLHSAEVDEAIASASRHWALEDVGKVERAVLRIGAYELLREPDVPVGAVINEAVELARTYAGEDAVPFVNGVLGRIAKRGEETA